MLISTVEIAIAQKTKKESTLLMSNNFNHSPTASEKTPEEMFSSAELQELAAQHEAATDNEEAFDDFEINDEEYKTTFAYSAEKEGGFLSWEGTSAALESGLDAQDFAKYKAGLAKARTMKRSEAYAPGRDSHVYQAAKNYTKTTGANVARLAKRTAPQTA